MPDVDIRQLERAASSGDPQAIRALARATERAGGGRNPRLYPWAGDQWRRLHWTIKVLDPAVMRGERRFVQVVEGFATKNADGRVEAPRDTTGRRVPPTQKEMPWEEWIWWTGTGGYPQRMQRYRKNNTPAACTFQVSATEIEELPHPPPPPPPPLPTQPTKTRPPPPPPPPPGAASVPLP